MLAIVAMILAACGPLGGDDDDPTATVETITQPTESTDPGGESTPDGPGFLPDDPIATPDPARTTPEAVTPNNPPGIAGTPDAPFLSGDATPVEPATSGNLATPESPGGDTSFAGSDGTSGATPFDPETVDEPTAPSDSETPSVPDDPATPGATPDGIALADIEPVTVTSCEPDTIPSLGGAPTAYLTNSDVNFRAGPGADCDTIGDGPLGTNIPVVALSGPVLREGDEFTWVQVEIAGDVGWVILSVLEPVS